MDKGHPDCAPVGSDSICALFGPGDRDSERKGVGFGSLMFYMTTLLGVDFYSGAAFKQYPSRIDAGLELSELKHRLR